MSTPMAAVANLEVIDGEKFFLSVNMTDNGAPILITPNSGTGSITDVDGNEILALPSTMDVTETGVITTQPGIFSISIKKSDVVDKLQVDISLNFDILLELVDFPELNPHKPFRGDIVKLTGSTP